VGAVLLGGAHDQRDACRWVTEFDLADPQLRHIWAVVTEIAAEDRRVEVADVVPAMVRSGHLPQQLVGRANGLVVDLLAEAPPFVTWQHFASIVLDESMRRQLRATAERLAQAADESSLSVCVDVLADGLNDAMETLMRIGKGVER
jgi:replicative DNA helicase